MRPTLSVIGRATEVDSVSDHVPISLRLSQPRYQPTNDGPIPRWVARHPLYEHLLKGLLDDLISAGDTKEKLQFFKCAARLAHKRFRIAISNCVASTVDEQLYFATLAYRAARSRSRTALVRALNCFPRLRMYVDQSSAAFTDACGLSQLIATLHRAKCDDEEAELELELDEQQKMARLQVVQRRRQAWALEKRRLCLSQIVDSSGVPYRSEADAAEELRRHWQSVAEEGTVNTDRWDYLKRYVQAVPDGMEWAVAAQDFVESIRNRKPSAPGPDGLPYSIYLLCDAAGATVLYDLYCDILAGGTPPDDFLDALMVFIPKGSAASDGTIVARTPDNVRPLSLSNTDCKLVTNAIAAPMNRVARVTVDGRQRGFVEGRQMLDNVIDLESMGITAQMRNATNAAFIFMDFAAAFPSILHDWILFVLSTIGFPNWLLSYFTWLYRGSRGRIVYRGAL